MSSRHTTVNSHSDTPSEKGDADCNNQNEKLLNLFKVKQLKNQKQIQL